MMAFIGDTRSRKILACARREGWGQIIVRGRLRGRRLDAWAYDNGAFEDWRHTRPFDGDAFEDDLASIEAMACKPRFIITPDVVAGGLDSLRFSLTWIKDCRQVASSYLAVQDGMTETDVAPHLGSFDGIFVGGSLGWKLSTGAAWVRFAHRAGKPCHIGRVGTVRRIAWARDIGADSIDSCLPMWSTRKLGNFEGILRQAPLFAPDRMEDK